MVTKSAAVRNADVDWNEWPVSDYLSENYRQLYSCDRGVIAHHSEFYRQFAPGSIGRSLEFGAGPNVYPLMLAAAASVQIDAVEPSAASVEYLRGQLTAPDESWQAFYSECLRLNAQLPGTLIDALSKVRVIHGDAMSAIEPGTYDAASMNFVAESVTEDADEFAVFCRTFTRSVRPGGYLVAAFMENMPSYRIADGLQWPGYPVDVDRVRSAFESETDELTVTRIGRDATMTDYGDTGMVLLQARR